MSEYIDRQAVLDELDEDIEEFVECDYALKTAKKYIKKIPPADVRPVVRSRWKKNDNGTYFCERCHSWIPEEQWHYANYCLYCGADMREDTYNRGGLNGYTAEEMKEAGEAAEKGFLDGLSLSKRQNKLEE